MSDSRYPVPLNDDGTLPRFINSDSRMVKSNELGTWVPYECVRDLLAPIRTLLQEARREHFNTYNQYNDTGGYCQTFVTEMPSGKRGSCTCGADAWNARIDALLLQTKLP